MASSLLAGNNRALGSLRPAERQDWLKVRYTSDVLESITDHKELERLISLDKPITRKVVSCPMDFANHLFERPLVFQNCRFEGPVDFSGARFGWSIKFIGCAFEKGLQMSTALVGGDCEFRGVTFREAASFTRAHIRGKLEMRAPKNKTEIDDGLKGVNCYVTFDCPAEFSQIHIEGETNFGSAQFHRWADFYNARIEGSAFFRIDRSKALGKDLGYKGYLFPPVRFFHGVRFRDASIGGELNFHGAQFWGTIDLSYIRVSRDVFFKDPEKQTSEPCRFSNKSLWIVNEIQEDSVIDLNSGPPTVIPLQKLETPDHVRALSKLPDEHTAFAVLRFKRTDGRELELWPQELLPEVTLAGARLRGSIYFEGANFEIPLNLENCKISHTLAFVGRNSLPKQINLSDCEYKHIGLPFQQIGCISKPQQRVTPCLESLMEAMKKSLPYRRQPWIQLESALRRMGDVKEADAVYIKRRRNENSHLTSVFKLIDKLWDLSSAYGTSPRRLLVIGFFVIFLGAILFGVGEVGRESENRRRIVRAAIDNVSVDHIRAKREMSSCLTTFELTCWITSAEISLYQFSPIRLPIAEDYQPEGWLAGWAALERIVGWIIVPLVVGTLAGQLNRKAEPKEEAEGADE